MRSAQVLIAGAGPTGLVLALWLTRLGVRVRLVDRAAKPGTTLRALGVQARTLEFYRQIGLAEAVVARGLEFAAANLWVRGRKVERGARVLARLKRPDGTEEACEADYLAGCDGARSRVREALGIGFPGGTYAHLFYVADAEGSGPVMDGELHVALDVAEFLAAFPMKGTGRARLIGMAEAPGGREALAW